MIPPILAYDEQKFVEETKTQVKSYLNAAGIDKVVIGLSTGLDSTATAYLTKEILGPQGIIAVHLPHHEHEKSSKEFHSICDLIGIPQENRHVDDIRPMLDAYKNKDSSSTIQMTNFLTRVQRAVLFDYSHKLNAPVMGTLNRTEYELGEFPIYALDGSIQPIRTLFKTQVRQLAKYLGATEEIQQRVPTIDTWMGKTDQIMRTRIVKIGIPNVDQILKCSIDYSEDAETIAKRGFDEDDVRFVIGMHKKNSFKQYLPLVPTLSDSAH